MATTLDELAERASSLSPDQRFKLAHRILSTLEPPVTDAIEKAWDAESDGELRNSKRAYLSRRRPSKSLPNLMLPSSSET
ncbi:MAG: hypothetical protein DLM73_14285 [Chthoniobacterales bacterium]|nr:MAG: hypothetical protein DLM73_14285 [Chthoniobacterales bacterium]